MNWVNWDKGSYINVALDDGFLALIWSLLETWQNQQNSVVLAYDKVS